jgi:VCBS repeat-containing protein
VTEHSIDTAAGTVVIRSDGSYDFTPLTDVKDDVADQVKYTVQDGDGSTASAYLHLATTDSSEVDAVDDLMSAFPSVSVGVDSVDFSVDVPGSMQDIQLNIPEVVADPAEPDGWDWWAGDRSQTTSYSQAFSTDAATTVSADIQVRGFQRWDTGSVYLQKQDSNGAWVSIGSSNIVVVSSENDVQFEITAPGIYRFAVSGDDDSSNGNLRITLKNISGTVYEFTPPTQVTDTKSYADVDWVAAALVSGSVITNDSLGSEGAVVVDVDGTSVSTGGTVINGEYGALTIHPDGSYSYVPNYAPDDADYVGGPLADSFSYTLEQPDGDYDTALLTFDVTPQLPDGAIVANSDSHVATGTDGTDYIFGTSGDDTLEGSGGDDYINGGAGNDYILGGTGNDHIVGSDGNDTLVGGAGDDLMTGGAGSDVFKYVDGDLDGVVHGDTITDFQFGIDGDILDVSALLNGENAGNLGNFLDFEVTNIDTGSGTATIEINVDQNGGGDFATHLATIEVTGVTAADNVDTVVNQMINQINIDHP